MIKVADVTDLAAGSSCLVDADGQLLALFNIDGTFHAIDDACPHQGAPLSDGDLLGCVVTCPSYGWQFDVSNGQRIDPPGSPNVEVWRVVIEGDEVFVEI